ncbi:MAG: hypothetical protein KJZ86_21785 [Caldilineaceae bacterium]|nr:hypothetical protein [Caldilineaceae bacterium]HRJ43149.1 hypothetical protein [Caldilineaceae bacterium]
MTAFGFTFEWLLGQLHPLRPGFWLLLSFGLSGLVLMVGPLLSARWSRRLRAGRWVLTPYLGLLAGGLSPRLLGLSDIDWVAGLGLGVGLTSAIWLLLALVRATLHRETLDRGPSDSRGISLAEQIVWAGAREFHWVFLRAAVWEMLLALPAPPELPGYWAIWLASLLALPGLFIQHRQTSQRVIGGLLLITTAILFFYTRNFYLCWLLHASAGLLIDQQFTAENSHPIGQRAVG